MFILCTPPQLVLDAVVYMGASVGQPVAVLRMRDAMMTDLVKLLIL